MLWLLASAASVAFFHALAPDHWLPFAALARSYRWSMARLAWVTLLAGAGHVASSLILGLIGLWLGLAAGRLAGIESIRGAVGVWLLIGFGVAYGLWGLKHAQHQHPHLSVQDTVRDYAKRRMWLLFAILVFGPCEPLIPLMFAASGYGATGLWWLCLTFSLVTMAMISVQSCLAYAGTRLIKSSWLETHAHTLAGFSMALAALLVLIAGI